jgi:sec-independent protein translocase protein TatA
MFSRLGWPEILIILVIILIIFGVGKLPQVGNAIGKGLRAFKRGQAGEEDEEKEKDATTTKAKKTTRKKAVKS